MVQTQLTTEDYQRAAALRSGLRQFSRRSEQIARRHGLTPRQYLLLLMIKGAPGGDERSTVTDLAERLALMQSTVTELVGRAEQAGLVRREPSPSDGRVVNLFLSEEGERLLAGIVAEHGPERRRLGHVVATLEDD